MAASPRGFVLRHARPRSVPGLEEIRLELADDPAGTSDPVRVDPQLDADELDVVFAALSDPTRRGVLRRLRRSDASISELATGFDMTLTGMQKHVRILEDAGLVATEKAGRVPRAREGRSEMTRRTDDQSRATTLSLPSGREIRLERVFDAPREHIWRAMTEPDLVAQWWGRGNRLDVVRLEVERGGHWRFVEHHDGEADGFEGRFREVTPPERIVQTFEWDGMPGHVVVNETTLEKVAPSRTRVIVVSLFHTPEERDGMLQSGMETGLNRSYDVLDAMLTSIG